jgi:hypothetical protein
VTDESSPNVKALFDPGWVFLVAGLALLCALAIIPAMADVDAVKVKKDQVLAIERHRESRISRYEEFIGAVDNREPSLLVSLAESQLNQIPSDRGALPTGSSSGRGDASVFPSLEPEPLVLPTHERPISRLERLSTDEKTRPVVMAVGAVCVLLGLLPLTRR